MATNLNTTPYYDDFDETKNFYQILFRPGYAVQARELTQLQTIIKKQIERFGNHIFKHGSIVIPGNSRSDIGVPYAKLEQTPTYSFTDDLFAEGDIIEGATNGVRAVVKKFANVDGADPRTVYFTYISGGTSLGVPNGANYFELGEEIFLVSDPTVRATIQTPATSIGLGSLASISDGVFYVNGYFAAVQAQTVVIDRYGSSPTCRVVLEIEEGIVTASEDETLLDPAQGSYNYAAPGADRLTVTLTLATRSYSDTLTTDYIELMRYNNGELEEHTRFPKYSELEKSLAKRTYEESGNYRVTGLNLRIFEHKKTLLKEGTLPNNGLYPDGDIGKFVLAVTPGRAYVNGFGIDNISSNKFILDKARTDATTKQRDDVSIRPNVGSYLYVSDLTQSIDFASNPTITLYNTPSFGTVLGTCKVFTIDSEYGSGNTDRVYRLGIYNLSLNSGVVLTDVGGFQISGGVQGKVCHKLVVSNPAKNFSSGEIVAYTIGATTRHATVEIFDRATRSVYVFRHNATNKIPVRGDQITGATSTAVSTVEDIVSLVTGGNSTAIVPLPYSNIKRVKNSGGTTTNKYYIWKHLTISTNGSGNGSATTSTGEAILAIDDGTFIGIGPSGTGVMSNTYFSLNPTATTVTVTGGPASSVVRVSCVVEKTNISERTKTLISSQTFDFSASGTNPVVTLPNTDIYKITKVTLDPTGAATDITSSCILDNGQRDFSYEFGRVTYLSTLAATTTIRVEYSYFQHSSTGDYFTIDSYSTFGSAVYDSVKTYTSSSGQTFDLVNCMDFRFSGTNGSTIVNDYRMTTSLQYFVGYNVLVYLDTQKPNIILGTPADQPTTPKLPTGMLRIGVVYIPPYVKNINDIKISEDRNYRYTMADIAKIDSRVKRLEYFSTLTMKEKSLVDFSVVDAETGLDRFKSGLIVEEFANQISASSMLDSKNNVTYLAAGITANVNNDVNKVSLLGDSTNYKVSDIYNVTMDFTEESWATQPMSSTVENLNPYLIFSWKGKMTLTPSFDSYVETVNLPTVYNNSTLTGTVTVNRERTTIIQPPKPPAVVYDIPAPAPSPAPQPSYPAFPQPILLAPPIDPPVYIPDEPYVSPESQIPQDPPPQPVASTPVTYWVNNWDSQGGWLGSYRVYGASLDTLPEGTTLWDEGGTSGTTYSLLSPSTGLAQVQLAFSGTETILAENSVDWALRNGLQVGGSVNVFPTTS